MKLDYRVEDPHLRTLLEQAYSVSRKITPKLETHVVRDVVFSPCIGLFSNGRPIPASAALATNGALLNKYLASGQLVAPQAARRLTAEEGPFFYLGIFVTCWGHCLLDNTRLLLPVVRKTLPPTTRFVYSLMPGAKGKPPPDMLANFRQLLVAAGVPEDRMLCIDEPTAFDEILLTDEVFRKDEGTIGEHYFAPEAKEIFQAIAKNIVPHPVKPFRKVYLSRSMWTCNAMDVGERRVGEAFRDLAGFEIVSPECLTFREQVKILQETRVLVTTEGSLAHNSAFLQPEAELVLLLKLNIPNVYQPMLNELMGATVTYIEANSTDYVVHPDVAFMGPFYLHLTRPLATYLNSKPERPFGLRVRFLWNVFWRWIYWRIKT